MKNSISLDLLRHGHEPGAPEGVCNVRVAGRLDGLDELCASIASLGLLQPLIVVMAAGLAYVADGNRRLAALMRLAAAGTIPADALVDVVQRDAATAREAGLAANLNQVRMHEADQYQAFSALQKDGLEPSEIAARFGIEPVRVRRILALGTLADEVLQAWRAGEFGRDPVETVRAFTLAPTLVEQREVLERLRGAGRLHAMAVKRELGVGEHDVRMHLSFVGRDAYVAAGGSIVEDLFGEEHRVQDPALLKRLVDDRVKAECDRLVSDGWAWAASDSQLPDNARWSWQQLRVEPRTVTEEELARLEELHAIVEAEEDDDAVAAAEEEVEAIERNLKVHGFTTEQKSRSGVIVRIGPGEAFTLSEGVVRPKTAAVAKAFAQIDGTDEATAVKAAKAEQAESGTISAALTLRLSQQRTLAVRDAMLASPQVALAALLASAIAKDAYSAPARMTLNGYQEGAGGPGADAETYEAAFRRLADLPLADLMNVAAGVAGQALDLQRHNAGAVPSHTKGAKDLEARLDGARLGETLRERWDAADYFKSAPKALLIRAVGEALGKAEADRIAGLTKPEIAAVAIARVVPTGWLPPELRHHGYELGEEATAPKASRKKAA